MLRLKDSFAENLATPVKAPGARLCLIALSLITLISLLLVVPPVFPQNALWWDYFMALGYLATGLLLSLPLITTRFWFLLGGNASESKAILKVHRVLTYVVVLFLALHIGGLLILDSVVIEYLKPSAPWGMVAALLASIAILLLVIQSEFRIRLSMRYDRWRLWHGFLTVVVVAGTFYHILEAKYFLHSLSELVTLAALSVAAGGCIFLVKRNYQPIPQEVHSGGGKMLMRITLLVTLLTSILIFVFAIPSEGNRAERQAMQCLLDDC